MIQGSGTTRASSRQGSGGVVIDGLDAVVRRFTRDAVMIRPLAEKTVVHFAEQAANRMRVLVPIDEGDTLESISSDSRATADGNAAYADAGPSWFVARFLEHGTVDTAPQPFVGPAGDEVIEPFATAIKGLSGL